MMASADIAGDDSRHLGMPSVRDALFLRRSEIDRITEAPNPNEGSIALHRAASRVGQMVSLGLLDRLESMTLLVDAAESVGVIQKDAMAILTKEFLRVRRRVRRQG
jgi:hypothetical protein